MEVVQYLVQCHGKAVPGGEQPVQLWRTMQRLAIGFAAMVASMQLAARTHPWLYFLEWAEKGCTATQNWGPCLSHISELTYE